MRLLGLAPRGTFSGFESSFFDAVREAGASVQHLEVEVPWFKLLSTIRAFHPSRNRWGNRLDRRYHTSIEAFRRKSSAANRLVLNHQGSMDAIYQVGGLWNPISAATRIPLILHVDYTSKLSTVRGSEWRRTPGREADFWIEEETRLYEQAAVVLTTTENARISIINDYGIDPGHVVTVGAGVSAPYDVLDSEHTPAWSSRRIFFVGKGFLGKGLDTILEAFDGVRRQIPDAQLTIVGPRESDIGGEGVECLGRIADRERVRNLYYEHAIFVMPSRFEPLGQVFLEAMSAQLPCIGTTLDAMPEMISHGETGFLIEPGDAQALERYIVELLGNPQRAEAFGRAGFRKLTDNHQWHIVGQRIHDSIAQALA